MLQAQTCFEISIDLFSHENAFNPNPRVRSFDPFSQYGNCSCQDIIQRQLRTGTWSEPFTQKILCLDPTNVTGVLKLLEEDLEGVNAGKSIEEQKQVMFDLKSVCECDKRETMDQVDIVENEWGLLDVGFVREGHLTTKLPSLTPVSTNFNVTFRPTPMVLHLATSNKPRQLRGMVNRKIKDMMLNKSKAKAAGGNDPGYVYIMQRDSLPGLVKVGFSGKHPAIRHDKLQTCYNDIRLLAHTTRIPLASKVESLVHAELLYFRRCHDCGRCGKQHDEWFEIDVEIVEKVILRWSQWVVCDPYSSISGVLNKEWKSKVVQSSTDNVVLLVKRFLKDQLKRSKEESFQPAVYGISAAVQRRRRLRDVAIERKKREVFYWDSPSKGNARS